LIGEYTRFLEGRWFWKASAGLEKDEELGLDLRGLVSATAGRYVISISRFRFELNGELASNREQRSDDTTTTSLEGLFQSSFDIFKYSLPIIRLSASISIFSGITESGRLRINSNVNLRNEIIDSVFWDLLFYSNYDNQPPDGASKDDFGVITSIGASF